jgi:hypothetical protein
MHDPNDFAHGDNNQPGNRADDDGEHDYTRLSRTDDGAQPVRNFELMAEQKHGERFDQAGMIPGLNANACRVQAMDFASNAL